MARTSSPKSVQSLEDLGRRRLSPSFFMRDFLHSEIAAFHGLLNVPENIDVAVKTGGKLCVELLEPLQSTFGRIAIRSAYRSPTVNAVGNEHGHNCASNEKNFAGHIWDMPNANGYGATACIVVPSFIARHSGEHDWKLLAWWIHDHLPYSAMEFFPALRAFNIGWHEKPIRSIYSHIPSARGYLTRPGMDNHAGSHEAEWSVLVSNFGQSP